MKKTLIVVPSKNRALLDQGVHLQSLKSVSLCIIDYFSQEECNSHELKSILTDNSYSIIVVAFFNLLDTEIAEVQMIKSLSIESKIIFYCPYLDLLKIGCKKSMNPALTSWYKAGRLLLVNILGQADMVIVESEEHRELVAKQKNNINTVTLAECNNGNAQIGIREKKKVSIIILTFNQLCDTKLCVETLERNTTNEYELIFVDNGSTDGTKKYLEKLKQSKKNVKVILNPSNLGFAKANNQGIAVSDGEYVLMLNNDVALTDKWLERLLVCAESDHAIGVVGPVTNNAVGEQVIDKNIVFNKNDINRYACIQLLKNAGFWFETHRIIGFCMLIKREVIENIGMLDERFGPGGYEDYDFCMRVKQAGYKIMIASDVFIYHIGGEGYKKNNLDYDKLRAQNVQIFIDKWCRKAIEFLDRLPDGL